MRLRWIAPVWIVIAVIAGVFAVTQTDSTADAWLVLATALALAGVTSALAVTTQRRRHATREVERYFTVTPEMVIFAGFDGYWKRVNPAVEAVLGYTEEEALSRPFMEFVHPGDRDRTDEAARGVIGGEPAFAFENRIVCKDGSYKWIEWTVMPVHEEGVTYGVGRDITGRRRSASQQAALRRIAILVAQGVQPQELFAAVAEEVGRVVEAPFVAVARYNSDDIATVCGTFPPHSPLFHTGRAVSLDGISVLRGIREHGKPARIDDYSQLEGEVARAVRTSGIRSGVGVPIVVAGRVWGSIVAWSAERLPDDFEARLAEFTELLAAAIANVEAAEALALLAEEQAALRRVATLVAQAVPPLELFSAVTKEVARVFSGVESPLVATVIRFDPGPECVLVGASSAYEGEPIGSRWAPKDLYVSTRVLRTGRPARVDEVDLETTGGPDADVLRLRRFLHQVGSPVVVEGRLWGAMTLNSGEALPPDTDERLENFTELIATAIANAQAREELRRVAEEQAALRRVATFVAGDPSPAETFGAVAEEACRILESEAVGLLRFEPDETATLVAQSDTPWDPPPLGTRFPLDGENLVVRVFRTGRAARVDDWAGSSGSVSAMATVLGIRSAVATPVVIEGRLWGTIVAATSQSEPLAAEMESRIAEFTELVATAIAKAEAREALRLVADEQAALRRVATLVAQGAQPDKVFLAVGEEVRRLFGTALAAVGKVEPDGQALDFVRPDGGHERVELADLVASAEVLRTGRSARADASLWESGEGKTAERLRSLGVVSSVSSPIVVESEVWGIISVGSADEVLAPDTEERLEKFTEIVATAIGNADSRRAVARLADEQAALRRVATLVARDAPSTEVFDAVATEVGNLLQTDVTVVGRYDGDGAATAIGSWSSSPEAIPVGTRSSIGGRNVLSIVAETGRPARLDDYEKGTGEAAEIARRFGWRSSIAAPITVEGRVWGVMLVATQREQPFPAGDEKRLAQFTDLVATAVANAQAHVAVQTAADEQGALRRVATLVAASAAPSDVFGAVTKEIALVLGADATLLCHADPAGSAVVVGTWGDNTPAVGTRIRQGGTNLTTIVLETGHSARIESYDEATGHASEVARSQGLRSAVGAPILVEGRLWGLVIAGTTGDEPLPPDAEERLAGFTELVATAIANAQSQGDLASLAEEQAALRRIATLVARGVEPEAIFAAVTEEIADMFGAIAAVMRFEHDPRAVVFLGVSEEADVLVGTRWELARGMASAEVYRTGRSARLSSVDWASGTGPMAEAARRLNVHSQVSSPIRVEGSLWGAISVNARDVLPPDTEERLEKFAELVTTAIANAESKSELAASRLRIVAASDETRRQIERDLHDGTQQRLVSLGLAVRAAEANLPAERDDLRAQLSGVAAGLVAAVEDLQEISRGIHPAILSKGGLGPALKAVAHRSAIPVDLDVTTDVRLAEPIEVAAYFAASEALANAVKHSQASRVDVSLEQHDGRLLLSVRDDGVGGADAARGSGLVGLTDRIEALGGSIRVSSRPGEGTQIAVELPVDLQLSPTRD
ncbi:MAG TPA: GAF domain-containing protein [Gaiellaceae bacterium]